MRVALSKMLKIGVYLMPFGLYTNENLSGYYYPQVVGEYCKYKKLLVFSIKLGC